MVDSRAIISFVSMVDVLSHGIVARNYVIMNFLKVSLLLPPARFCKTAGGIVLGSVAVSTISVDILLYISVAIKASFLKLGMCNICKNNIAKMVLDFFKI